MLGYTSIYVAPVDSKETRWCSFFLTETDDGARGGAGRRTLVSAIVGR